MPELPEVETIKRQLVGKVTGLNIQKIEILKPKLFKGNSEDIIGAKIEKISRRAKMFVIDLVNRRPTLINKTQTNAETKLHLLIHLKMTGQLIYVDKNGAYGGGHPIPPFNLTVPNVYSHIIFDFTDGSRLYFNDLRQFGWIKVLSSEELDKEFEKIGIEPFSKEFTFSYFIKILEKKKKSPIKLVLMDQALMVGIGNIYANEICFMAHVMPDRKIETLNKKEMEKIYDAIFVILNSAIKYQGTSAVDYVTLEGKTGSYDQHLMVYGKTGEPCPNKCSGNVEKIKLGGRGTFFCRSCQR
jgi:formamidopyrimidine-DNA glycosylase